jgi:hypothetical protein
MIVMWIALASAGPCDSDPIATGPVSVALRDGALGSGRRACPRREVGVSGHALLLDDTGNLNIYGQIQLQGVVDASVAVSDRVEVFARLEAIRSQQAISLAGASYTGLGHTTLGVSALLVNDVDTHVAWLNRVVLPTAVGLYRNQHPVALESGLSAQLDVGEALQLYGQLSVIGSMGLGGGPTQVRVGLAPSLGAELTVKPSFGVAVGVTSGLLYDHPFEQLSPQVSLRTAIGKVGIQLDAMVPVTGPTPRPLVVGPLGATYRFD